MLSKFNAYVTRKVFIMNTLTTSRIAEINLANKMIWVYKHTGIEQYPEARALDVLDTYSLNDPVRIKALALFNWWLEQEGGK